MYLNSLSNLSDILVLTEIWIYSCELNIYNINGYNQYAKCNDDYRSGGVIVFVKNDCVASASNVEIRSADVIKITLEVGSLTLAIIAVYRLHSQTILSFLDDLNSVLSN